MAVDIHPNPWPTAKYPCPVCARDVTSRGVRYWCTRCTGWVHAKCSGLLNAAQYRRNKDWTCYPFSASKTQKPTTSPPSPSPTPAPSADQISDNSTFNVLQFNGNGIGNKLTELGVVLERNKVKVAVIQESKLSSISKNPCILNYTTVRKDRPHRDGFKSRTSPSFNKIIILNVLFLLTYYSSISLQPALAVMGINLQ